MSGNVSVRLWGRWRFTAGSQRDGHQRWPVARQRASAVVRGEDGLYDAAPSARTGGRTGKSGLDDRNRRTTPSAQDADRLGERTNRVDHETSI